MESNQYRPIPRFTHGLTNSLNGRRTAIEDTQPCQDAYSDDRTTSDARRALQHYDSNAKRWKLGCSSCHG